MKRFQKMTQLTNNRFLNLFHLEAINKMGGIFDYFFVSRNDKEHLKLITHGLEPEGIVIYALLRTDPSKLVMIRQYRYPLDEEIYELPAGLVDRGESTDDAAIREMLEETGMKLTLYHGGNPALRRPFFMGAGFTDETSTTVYGWAEGEMNAENQEDSEQIHTLIIDRTEAKRILKEEKVSMRGAYLLMHFIHADSERPFAFLE
ncbi:MAG: NUDIX hydrolase [Lachnospiraceae bacterium]|nr:NUDIX hydrolase [Lachnospiraceae bacterium]MDD3660586.1 NUDIX hydrolase [Lachnospiraceae bacterium]